MSNSETSQRRKRWHSKVKTGCKTCRRRRVKCDEAKPLCRRCLNAAEKCEGYEDAPDGHEPLPTSQSEDNQGHQRGALTSKIYNVSFSRDVELYDSSEASSSSNEWQGSGGWRRSSSEASDRSPRPTVLVWQTDNSSSSSSSETSPETRSEHETQLTIRRLGSRSMDAVDPFRQSILAETPYASKILSFWQVWTKGAPYAIDALQVCLQDQAALASILAVNALFMQLCGVDEDASKKHQVLTYRALRNVRSQIAANAAFLQTDAGLNALSWLMLAAWFSGKLDTARTHLRGFRAIIDSGSRKLEDFPLHLQQSLAYIDFMLAMGHLEKPIIGYVPNTLTSGLPSSIDDLPKDLLIESLAVQLRREIDGFKHLCGDNFADIKEEIEAFIYRTHATLAICMGSLPVSYYPQLGYTNMTSMLHVHSFAFEPADTVECENTARIGLILILWTYANVAPFGFLINGGFFTYTADVFLRFPAHKAKVINEACHRLNALFERIKSSSVDKNPRQINQMICDEISEHASVLCGPELRSAAVMMRHYMKFALETANPDIIMQTAIENFDLTRRIRFLGRFLGTQRPLFLRTGNSRGGRQG